MKAILFDIQKNSFVDGPGIRTVVFFKGCNLRCRWCHNPESQSLHPQMMIFHNKCKGCGKCKEVCPYHLEKCDLCGKCELYCTHDARKICGKEYTVQEVMKELVKDISFYEGSGGGVTFSGGECMLQPDFLTELLKECKKEGIHTAIDTAGCVSWEIFEKVLPYTDMFLYDIKAMNNRIHKEYTGVDNDLILDNLAKLLKIGASVWVRVPVIPSVNDTEDEMKHIRDFFEKNGYPEKLELHPYHSMGEHKYAALDRKVEKFNVPNKEEIEHLYSIVID